MTEHVEQYEQQEKVEDAGKQMLTTAERTMIRDLILLPYIDTMVSKSMQGMDRSGNTLTRMFLMAGRYVQNRIMKDTYRLQRGYLLYPAGKVTGGILRERLPSYIHSSARTGSVNNFV